MDSELCRNAFSADYAEAKRRFTYLVSRLPGFKLCTLALKNGFDIDIGVRDVNAAKTLIHISGTHGVEGYAGSAIQISTLNDVNLVFVHILNPWGMANNCRWNENNVDLNRNMMGPEEFQKLKEEDHSAFDSFASIINVQYPMTSFYEANINFYMKTFGALLCAGCSTGRLKSVIVNGQGHDHKGLFYVGNQMEDNNALLLEFLEHNFLDKTEFLYGIDVHSGLGESGKDYIMTSHPESVKFVGDRYPGSDCSKSVEKGYNKISSVAHGVRELFSKCKAKVFFTQEFGTVNAIEVLRALIMENSARHYGDKKDVLIGSQASRDAFYVNKHNWKENVVKRGFEVLIKTLGYIRT